MQAGRNTLEITIDNVDRRVGVWVVGAESPVLDSRRIVLKSKHTLAILREPLERR